MQTMANTCVVIPLYNEETRFDIDKFIEFNKLHPDLCFCLVNDGSTDNTPGMLAELHSKLERVEIIDLKKNKGKAEAIRSGVSQMIQRNDIKYIAFIDADLSAPLETIPFLLAAAPGKSVILGSRILILGTTIIRKPFRHYIGRVFATMASETLNLPIYDTQCGAKIFSREIAEIAFNRPFKTRWLFDLELIMRIVNHTGWEKFKEIGQEVPLYEWVEKGGSKVKLSYMFKLPFDLLRVRKEYGKVKK